MLLDTQADISLLKKSSIRNKTKINSAETVTITGVTDGQITSLGILDTTLHIQNTIIPHEFHIVPDTFSIPVDGIIGKDFMKEHKCLLNYDTMLFTIHLDGKTILIPIIDSPEDGYLVLPARSEAIRRFQNINSKSDQLVPSQEIASGIFLARTIVSPKSPFVRVMNTNSITIKITNKIPITNNLEDYVIASFNTQRDKNREQKLLKIISPNFPAHVKEPLTQLCTDYADIFHLDSDKLTTNNFYKQQIKLTDNTPVYIKNYRMPHAQKDEINRQIDKLIENDLIEPSTSSYNSPLLIVPKKTSDGTQKFRMCIDYRSLNKKVTADKFPLPRMEEIFDGLGKAKYFTVLDLASGFHQIPLHENSRNVTSFSCEKGAYRWKVLPFGLNISPNSFARMMKIAFSGVSTDQCFLYMDDIIVIGQNEKNHLTNLEKTFSVCRKHNLKINPEKAQFFRGEVTYLGHKCTSQGILPDSTKINSVQNYPKPIDKDSTRRFVAFANFYRKFIRNFAETTRPLNFLTKHKTIFKWTQECDDAFEKIKHCLLHPPILTYPDFSKQFILTVDASNYAMGAVLSQEINGHEHPIAYASKQFTKGEFNKSTIEKELAAIHWGIQHYRPYLYNTFFRVKSDHKPLIYLFAMKNPSSKLTRMRLDLEEYTFSIEYIKGKTNVIADAMSRINFETIKALLTQNKEVKITTRSMTKLDKNKNTMETPCTHEANTMETPSIYEATNTNVITKFPRLTTSTHQNNTNIRIKHKNRLLAKFDISSKGRVQEILPLALCKLEKIAIDTGFNIMSMPLDDNIFHHITVEEFKQIGTQSLKHMQIVLNPIQTHVNDAKTQLELLQIYHDHATSGGHSGKARTLAKIKNKYFWKNMRRDVASHVDKCDSCKKNKPKYKTKIPLKKTTTPQKPFDVIIVDTIGPLPKSINGNTYAITIMCALTKYLVSIPTANKEAITIARNIFNHFILIYGPMLEMLTDLGTEYKNQTIEELFKLLNITHKTSTAYHHETVGLIERNHRTLNEYLRAYLSDSKSDWDEYIRYFTFCYNTTPHSSLKFKYTPYELVFGKSNTPFQTILTGRVEPIYNIENFSKEVKYRLQQSHIIAKKLTEMAKNKTKSQYDKTAQKFNINIGDKVLLKNENRHKLDTMYLGPFIVIEIKETNTVIEDPNSKKQKEVHQNRLIKYLK